MNNITRWLIIVVLFSVPSFATLLQPGYFGMHDDIQTMRVYQMDKCFKDLQIPCRWVPDMGYGYGYPLYNYYPVMPYYLGQVIHFLGVNFIWTVKILFMLSFIISAITMYLLSRTFWGNFGGLISSIFYVYAPYHAVDVYVRGAMAESWSLSFAPLVFLMIYKTIQKGSIENILLLAVSIALFLMSHNPLALVFTPIMIIWALIFIVSSKNFKSIVVLSMGGLWGLGLAAFFTIPVILEGKLVHLETLFIGYFNYLAHFIDLNQMFVSRFWGFGGSIWGPEDGMPFQIGWLHWGTTLLAIPISLFFGKKDKVKTLIILFAVAVFWVSAFIMHPRSNPIWEVITILQTIQFPWRILAVTIFVSSFIVGSIFALPMRHQLKWILFAAFLLGIVVLYIPYFKIEKPLYVTDADRLAGSGAFWDLQRTAGIFDYLPKSAPFPPAGPAPENIEVMSGFATVKNLQKGSNFFKFEVESTSGAHLRLPIIYFPNWKVSVNNKDTSFDIKNELGQPTFEVKEGNHQVYARLYNTPLRNITNIISIVSFAAVVYIVWRKKYGKG